MRALYEYQTGGYPLDQVMVVEDGDNGVSIPKICAFFADAEMDVFLVEYGPHGEVTIHTKHLTHIATSADQLSRIASLAADAETLRAEVNTFYDNESETWSGHEHLITRPRPDPDVD